MTKQDLDQEIEYWAYQKKAAIMHGDLQTALESEKNVQQLLKEGENVK